MLEQDVNTEYINFNMDEINHICDAFLSDYTDDRQMSDFKTKSVVGFEEQKEDCLYYFDKLFLYTYYDKFDTSKRMKELEYYMKRRLDADMSP